MKKLRTYSLVNSLLKLVQNKFNEKKKKVQDIRHEIHLDTQNHVRNVCEQHFVLILLSTINIQITQRKFLC